jgi:predicted RNase H-like nuclease (RuvC/YqgF family)
MMGASDTLDRFTDTCEYYDENLLEQLQTEVTELEDKVENLEEQVRDAESYCASVIEEAERESYHGMREHIQGLELDGLANQMKFEYLCEIFHEYSQEDLEKRLT